MSAVRNGTRENVLKKDKKINTHRGVNGEYFILLITVKVLASIGGYTIHFLL